jgi:hypothetical protein
MKLENKRAINYQHDLKRVEFTKDVTNIRIVIKYMRVHKYLRHLNLNNCNVSDGMINELTDFLINDDNLVLSSLELAGNKITNEITGVIANYISSNSDLVTLNLENNPGITNIGLFKIL